MSDDCRPATSGTLRPRRVGVDGQRRVVSAAPRDVVSPKPARTSARSPSPNTSATINDSTNIGNYSGVRPFSAASDPFQKKLSAQEVAAGLERLYTHPVEALREYNAAMDAYVGDVLLHATQPAAVALRRGRLLAAEYRRQHRAGSLGATSDPQTVAAAGVPLPPPSPPPCGRTHSHSPPADAARRPLSAATDVTTHGASSVLSSSATGVPPRPATPLTTTKEFVERFYRERKRAVANETRRLAVRFLQPVVKSFKASPEEEADALDRLYTRRPRPGAVSAAAAAKLYGKPPVVVPKSKEALSATIAHLYSEPLAAREAAAAKEEAAWQAKRRAKTKIVPVTDMAVIIARLGTPYGKK